LVLTKIPFFGSVQVSELCGSSAVLIELESAWELWTKRMVPQKCQVRCIYGTADKIVPAAGARGNDPDAVPILGANHVDIVKPTDPTDEIVLTLNRFLSEAGFESITSAPEGRAAESVETKMPH